MNILFVAHERNMNGSSRSMVNIIEALQDQHRFYVAIPWNSGEVYETLSQKGITVISAPGYKEWIQPRKCPWAPKHIKENWYLKWVKYRVKTRRQNQKIARQVYEKIKDLQIDIIHSNTSVIDLGARLSELGHIPHIWHVREMGIDDFNLYPYVGWQKAYTYMSEHADRIIAISDAVYSRLKPQVDEKKCVRIYNGVGLENSYEQRSYRNCADDPFKVLIAGTISRGKRQDLAVKAVDELRRRGYQNVELYIAGRRNLRFVGIPDEEVGDYIHLLGQLNNLHEYRHGMNAEVVCSACEAFGRVTVEAMLSGLPVVASASGASVELIQQNTGLLFEPGNWMDLANKLEQLRNDCSLAKELGEKAHRYALEHFTIERCANEINAVYMDVKKNR